jgi:hypothetical protein
VPLLRCGSAIGLAASDVLDEQQQPTHVQVTVASSTTAPVGSQDLLPCFAVATLCSLVHEHVFGGDSELTHLLMEDLWPPCAEHWAALLSEVTGAAAQRGEDIDTAYVQAHVQVCLAWLRRACACACCASDGRRAAT